MSPDSDVPVPEPRDNVDPQEPDPSGLESDSLLCNFAGVSWIVFVISGITVLLDILEVVNVPWDEAEVAVLLISGALGFGFTVGCGMQAEGGTSATPGGDPRRKGAVGPHAFDSGDTCTRCGRSRGAIERFGWSCEAKAKPRQLAAEPEPLKEASPVAPAEAAETERVSEASTVAPPAAAEPEDETPLPLLFLASGVGEAEIVQALLDQGADVHAKTGGGVTALIGAADSGHEEVVALLLAHGAEPDAQAEGGYSALYLAAQNGHVGVVRALLRGGASVDMQTWRGATPLQVAAQQGRTEVAKTLLDHAATVDLDSRFVPRAVVIAMHEGHAELVDLLTEATEGIVRVDGLSYLGTLPDDELPIGDAVLSGGRITMSIWRSSRHDGGTDSGLEASGQQGHCSIFVFDYDRMSSEYGSEAFDAIGEGLEGSSGVCAFLDGDLDVAAGGSSKVPGLLMEIRDNGWVIGTTRGDSPLIILAVLDRLSAYVAAMWTDNPENIAALDGHLTSRFPDAYLGFLKHPGAVDLPKFHEIFRPLELPVRATYVDGRQTEAE